MWRFIQKHPQLQEVLSECRETMKDMAESQLYNQVLAGDPGQVRFFLSSQAKDRGYVPRTETTNLNEDKPKIVEVVVRSRREAKELLGLKDEADVVENGDQGAANSSTP
jgi:hypothetical protein